MSTLEIFSIQEKDRLEASRKVPQIGTKSERLESSGGWVATRHSIDNVSQ